MSGASDTILRAVPIFTLWSALLLVGGCSYSVHQAALGHFEELPPSARLRPIQAAAEQDVFLLTGNTDFADEAMARLGSQCPQGEVVGIQARHSTSLGFLVHTNRLNLTAYCVEPSAAKAE